MLSQFVAEFTRWQHHQVKVAKGEVSHTKKYGTFYAGPVLEVLLRKWFPVGAVIDQTARRVQFGSAPREV
ncbi:unnamed protein product [Sphagnum balticum]